MKGTVITSLEGNHFFFFFLFLIFNSDRKETGDGETEKDLFNKVYEFCLENVSLKENDKRKEYCIDKK